MDSLIPAAQPIAVMAGLFSIAGIGFLLEKTKVGALLTGTVWTILLAILATNLRIMPFESEAYDFVFKYAVPVLIPLFLLKADLRRILFETTRVTAAFLIATVGTVAGVFAAVALIDLGAREAGVAGALAASYIGGSVNFAALVDTTGLGAEAPGLVSAIVAADHLASAAYLAILAVIPGVAFIARRFTARDHSAGEVEEAGEGSSGRASALSLGLTLAYALIVVAVGDALTRFLDAPGFRYLIITGLALILPTLAPRQMAKLHGGFELGVVFAFVFFGAIAAGADVSQLLSDAPLVMAFIAILLVVHAAVAFPVAMVFRLSLPEIIIASNAAILGATTAPALAAAKGWRDLVTPGVLAGVLGYVLGTVIGTFVYRALA